MSKGDLIAIDVGVNGMGWARWEGARRDRSLRPPDTCGIFEIENKWLREPFEVRADMVMMNLMITGYSFGGAPWTQVMEWPEFRAGSAVGHAAASTDSLSMLAFMCGQHCRQGLLFQCENVLVPVSEWKGQLPKDVVERRLRAAIGGEARSGVDIESHAWDAVGIGLHWLGHSVKKMSAGAAGRGASGVDVSSPRRRVVVRRKP